MLAMLQDMRAESKDYSLSCLSARAAYYGCERNVTQNSSVELGDILFQALHPTAATYSESHAPRVSSAVSSSSEGRVPVLKAADSYQVHAVPCGAPLDAGRAGSFHIVCIMSAIMLLHCHKSLCQFASCCCLLVFSHDNLNSQKSVCHRKTWLPNMMTVVPLVTDNVISCICQY